MSKGIETQRQLPFQVRHKVRVGTSRRATWKAVCSGLPAASVGCPAGQARHVQKTTTRQENGTSPTAKSVACV